MHETILFMIVGACAGVLSGFFGIGGGLVIIPCLVYLCGFDQLKAQGTSLAVLLPPVGIIAFIEYYKRGQVDVKAAALICVTVLLGSIVGSKLVPFIPVGLLKKMFAGLMLIVSIRMLLGE